MKKHFLLLVIMVIGLLSYSQPTHELSSGSSVALNATSDQINNFNTPGKSTTITWSGSEDTDWNNIDNWVGAVLPRSIDDVIIPAGCSFYPVLSSGNIYHCNNLTVEGNTFSIFGIIINGELSVHGDLLISPTGSIKISSLGALTVTIDITIEGNLFVENLGSLINYGEVTGIATIQRNIPSNMAWHLISSPVSGQGICNGEFAPPFPGSFPGNINTWDVYNWLSNCPTPPTPAEHWRNLRRPNGKVNTVDFPGLSFIVTRGYLVAYGSGWSTTKNFTGPPSSCTKICAFYDVSSECSWALPGNPFPSSIDWSLIPDKSNLTDDYYFVWNEQKAGGPGYEFWKDGTHFSSTNVDGFIPPMQGFFVKVDPTGGRILTLINGARAHHNSTDTWLKESPSNKLTITLSNGANYDEAFIMFEENSITGKDRSDAEKMFSLNSSVPQIYSLIDNDIKTGFNSLPYLTSGTTIPIGFVAPAEGNYTIKISGIESFTSLEGVTLEDTESHYTQNLLQNPEYSFSSSGIENAERFLLHFSGPIGVNETNINPINIYANEKTIFITSQTGFSNAEVTICNLLGQKVLGQQLANQKVNQITKEGMTGYYLVKVQTETSVKTAKVYIR